MTSFATAWQGLRAALRERGAELRLCLRVTIAATLSLAVSHLLNLPLALWTVLTAVILTQMSVGRSLKATMDYFVATVGGAAYAGAVGALIPHDNEAALLAALALAVAPAALLAATNPRFSATPFTAVMVFLAPFITHTVRSRPQSNASSRSRSEASSASRCRWWCFQPARMTWRSRAPPICST